MKSDGTPESRIHMFPAAGSIQITVGTFSHFRRFPIFLDPDWFYFCSCYIKTVWKIDLIEVKQTQQREAS